jgi:S-adenosylmethionine:tRNA ribosyltransferase-isomerase
LVVDLHTRRFHDSSTRELAKLLYPGDLLVVNDAATLPASLHAQTSNAAAVELRLLGAADPHGVFDAVLLGAGDHRTRTEDRPAPPRLQVGAQLLIGPDFYAEIVGTASLSTRLYRVHFNTEAAALWTQLYRWGKPIQYANQPEPIPLWSVQTAYATRPWAAEMPSAGRPLSVPLLQTLLERGVEIAALTHAAGVSSTGDPAIDRALPLPERYEIPASTVQALAHTHARAGRVIAVGTSVVRALEAAYLRGQGQVQAGAAIASLRIGPEHRLQVVDGLLTGIHAPEESHFALLNAFVDHELLRQSYEHARRLGYREHEFGDLSLLLPVDCSTARLAPTRTQLIGLDRDHLFARRCGRHALPTLDDDSGFEGACECDDAAGRGPFTA